MEDVLEARKRKNQTVKKSVSTNETSISSVVALGAEGSSIISPLTAILLP